MSRAGEGPGTESASRPVPRAPQAVRWIVRTLEEAGHETWAVGGAVRDALLGRQGGDWDLATAARPERVRRLFRRTVPVGLRHGTVGVLARDGTLYEVTTFRRDVETDGRHAVVSFADHLDEDLARRDFTINAIAWHPLRLEYHDPFHGVDDLAAGVLRTVGVPGERFAEDYLRILRALRFAGRFGLAVEPATWGALTGAREGLPRLSPERVREELLKVLETPRPSAGLSLYTASGVLETLFPELERLVPGHGPAASGMEDGWTRSLLVVDALAGDPLRRLAALLQRLGDPSGGEGPDSRTRGTARALALLERLRFSTAQGREVAALVDLIGFPPPDGASPRELRRWLARAGREPLPALFRIWVAGARVDARRKGDDPAPVMERIRRMRRELRSGAPLSVDELAVDGRDLMRMGLRPGPDFGRILKHLLARTLDDPGRNRPEVLAGEVDAWLREARGPDGGGHRRSGGAGASGASGGRTGGASPEAPGEGGTHEG